MDKLKLHNQKQTAIRLERKREIVKLRKKGLSLREIGERMGNISRQAVWIILR